MMRFKSFLAGFLLLLLLIMITLKMKLFFGWSPDLILPLLVAFGFVAGFTETFFLAGIAAWILNWQPRPSLEIVLIALLPLLAFLARRFSPGRPVVTLLVLLAVSFGAWYLIVPGAWADYYIWLTLDGIFVIAAAFFFTGIFRTFYGRG